MRGKFVLSIGVRKSGQLPVLDGAISDALKFAEWASAPGRGYTVKLVTDEDGAVTVDRIKTELGTILDEDVSRLLIFYSGHGICSQAGDYWLLSNFDRESDEAVNLVQSMRNARRLGIGQIAVFSDACRTSLSRAALVSGRVIFPAPQRSATMISPYDEFLSTDIGDVAQEVADEDPSKSYGVFSKCLLTALSGFELEAAELRAQRRVISSVALATWLEKVVPLQSGKIPGGAVQYPSITASWRAPDDEYAECLPLPDPNQPTPRVLAWEPEAENLGLAERLARRVEAHVRVAERGADRERQVRERAKAFQAQRGRENFETEQGLTIVGSKVIEIVVPQGTLADLFEENGHWHVRGSRGAYSVALRTDQNLWIAATSLPGFIGTLVVGDEGVQSLNYAPPKSRSYERQMNLRSEEIVAEWNALLSVNRQVDPRELEAFAQEARRSKHINPAFGVLAAYAYERIGLIDEVASIAWHFADRNQFVPFDVMALLSAYGDPKVMIQQHGRTNHGIVTAGRFPMLTRGWAMLNPDSGARPSVVGLQKGLMNSVWTAFNDESGRRFADLVQQGKI